MKIDMESAVLNESAVAVVVGVGELTASGSLVTSNRRLSILSTLIYSIRRQGIIGVKICETLPHARLKASYCFRNSLINYIRTKS